MRVTGDLLRLSASDEANFLACQHLTRLDLLRARGLLSPPAAYDLGFEDLIKRGVEHERTVLEKFRADGCRIVEFPNEPGADGAADTAAAIQTEADVIYQGTLTGQHSPGGAALLGRPDFLVRAGLLKTPDGEPPGEGAGFEVVDAKLARTAKGRAVAQIAFYSHLLAALQGTTPRWMHLALGNGKFESFKVAGYSAYERQARRVLTDFIAADDGANPPADTYPEPVEHCAICRWSPSCKARRRADDDLSLIAGITKKQRQALKAEGVPTVRGFARLSELQAIPVNQESLGRAQLQAQLQVASADSGHIEYRLLPPERDEAGGLIGNRGLLALPEPTPGDLFFDIEGARFYSEDADESGLQYLFGIVDTADTDAAGVPRYHAFWCFNRQEEKRAFEALIDFITERRRRFPHLHVYHYNHYEPTSVDHLTELHETRQEAVGRLMGRFATREDEVDDLFRLGVFVDLYRVVRQGLRAGVESYSIKRLEPLCGYGRRVDLREATSNLIAFDAALEDGSAAGDLARQQVVAGYNEDDCRATLALREWLEDRRAELAAQLGEPLPRPAVKEEDHAPEDPKLTRIRDALLAGLPADPAERTPEQNAKALLADLLDWHRREAKPGWWRYFYLRTLSAPELIGEPDALGSLADGKITEQVQRSVVYRFTFPAQEHRFSKGDTAYDPLTRRGWTVWEIDDEHGTIDLKISKDYDGPLPAALVPQGPFGTTNQRDRLRDLGDRVAREGVTGRDAATALLERLSPATTTQPAEPLRRDGETAAEAARRLVQVLDDSYLPIQGPPGTGKTYNGARQILKLVARGRTAGIVGPSHAVISNLITNVAERAEELRVGLPHIGQRRDRGEPHLNPHAESMTPDRLLQALEDGEIHVAAGTAWLWSREEFAHSVDTLFVDEAGQMSLADVLAVAGAARNLVLLGDPQQLAQPSQAAHPPGAGASALEHIIGGHATMPEGAGLLLETTWRMHPWLCHYTSEAFYDGKLTGIDGLENQEIVGDPALGAAGLRVIAVAHQGNTNASGEEAERVAQLTRDLLRRHWRDRHGGEHPIGPADILIVTPYNAQIRAIENALISQGCPGDVQVGTVDKFQGRQAPVVIYSMATSSADEAPHGLEFLYDPHRLNVGTSRAKAMAIIVASPELIRVPCRTPRQMELANPLCFAFELGTSGPPGTGATGT